MSTRTRRKPTREAPPIAPLPGAVDALLSLRDFGRAIGAGYSTVKAMRGRGELPPADTQRGSKPLWRCSTVNAFIEESCHARRDAAS